MSPIKYVWTLLAPAVADDPRSAQPLAERIEYQLSRGIAATADDEGTATLVLVVRGSDADLTRVQEALTETLTQRVVTPA